MGEDSLRRGRDDCGQRFGVIPSHSGTGHSRIDLAMIRTIWWPLPNDVEVVENRSEVVLEQCAELYGACGRKHDHRSLDADLTQPASLIDRGHAKAPRIDRLERAHDRPDAETVAIRLDHGKEGSVMRRAAYGLGVLDEVTEVDFDPSAVVWLVR